MHSDLIYYDEMSEALQSAEEKLIVSKTLEGAEMPSDGLAPVAYYGRKKPIVDKQERRAKSKNARKSRRKNRA